MIGQLLYYVILFPLSLLPIRILYLFSNFLYLLLYYVFGYRKNVVIQNIEHSFPELDTQAKNHIVKEYYKHFSDIIVEGIKSLSISKSALTRRYKLRNPELIEAYFMNKQSIILCSGHINNWEWWITYQNTALPHQALGIGMPLTQQSLGAKINQRRERLGMIVTDSKDYKKEIEKLNDTPYALLILGDQSPGSVRKSYWTPFLQQLTAFTFGTEIIANTYNLPVIYYTVHKVKRGYYELEFKVLSDTPHSSEYGEITEKYVHFLEKDILNAPSQWIWSHKRWKKSIPNDLNTIKNEHKKQFNARFRNL